MKVILESNTPTWKEIFRRNKATIEGALCNLQPTIDHIGSIAANPIVVLMSG